MRMWDFSFALRPSYVSPPAGLIFSHRLMQHSEFDRKLLRMLGPGEHRKMKDEPEAHQHKPFPEEGSQFHH